MVKRIVPGSRGVVNGKCFQGTTTLVARLTTGEPRQPAGGDRRSNDRFVPGVSK